MASARTPYGIDIPDTCSNCQFRKAGFFCDFQSSTLATLESISYTTSYPGRRTADG